MPSPAKPAIHRYFPWLFWPLLLLLGITLTFIRHHQQYLQLPAAPAGIYSLQLAGTDSAARAMVNSWRNDTVNYLINSSCSCDTAVYCYRINSLVQPPIHRLDYATAAVYAGYWLMTGYVLLGLLIMIRLEHNSTNLHWYTRWLLLLPLLAGLCDGLVQTSLLCYLRNSGGGLDAPVYTVLSKARNLLLGGFVLGYLPVRLYQRQLLRWLSVYLLTRTRQLWRYRVLVLGILAVALPLWLLNQVQDLLVNVNESDTGVVLFLGAISVMALLNWYLAKLFFPLAYHGPLLPVTEPVMENAHAEQSEKKVSRFLGVAMFLIPAFGILHALDAFKIPYLFNFLPPTLWLLLCLAACYLLLKYDAFYGWYRWLARRTGNRPAFFLFLLLWAVCTLLLPLALRLSVAGGAKSITPASLNFVAIDLLFFALGFLLFVSIRSVTPGIPVWLRNRIGLSIYFAAGVPAMGFVLANIFPGVFSFFHYLNFICLPLLFSGVMLYVLLFTLLLRLGNRTKVNFTFFLLVSGLAVNLLVQTSYHNARLINRTPAGTIVRQLPLQDYFAQWLLHRSNEIDAATTNRYPVVLVNAYGGGIRAAAFTSMVVTTLNDSVASWSGGQPFEHHVFAYSGVSGGTIGASVLCAYRYHLLEHPAAPHINDSLWNCFYRRDFLTPVLTGMLGKDLLAAITGTSLWQDRAAVQEILWEKQVQEVLGADYSRDFYSYWDTAHPTTRYEIPLLFSNTCNVDDGAKGILCPVQLQPRHFPSTHFLDTLLLDKTVALSTAAFFSARFPLISPTAKLQNGFHFIDGGIQENSGAETSGNLFLALQELYQLDSATLEYRYPGLYPLLHRTSLYFLSIGNASHSQTEPDKAAVNLFQLTSAVIGLYNSGVQGNSRRADSTLRFRYPTRYAAVWPDVDCIPLDTLGHAYSPVLPLGWQVSTGALERLHASVRGSRYFQSTGNDGLPAFGQVKQWFRR